MLRTWFSVFDRIVANSVTTQSMFSEEGIITDVVHNGIVIPPAPTERPVPGRILFAGRLVEEKGASVLIEAFRRIACDNTGASLVIAGDGPERPKLEAKVQTYGLEDRVLFSGFLTQEELQRELIYAQMQVVPSIWAEPFGLAALDSMAGARAVVASSVGGLTEIVSDGETGFLVPPDDPDALAERIALLIHTPHLAESFGQAGYARASALFSIRACVDQFETIYRGLIK